MPSKLLKATQVKAALIAGHETMLSDGAGLYLEITGPHRASWMYRYTPRHGKRQWMSLGPWREDYGLAQARIDHAECVVILLEGRNPKTVWKVRKVEQQEMANAAKPGGLTFADHAHHVVEKVRTDALAKLRRDRITDEEVIHRRLSNYRQWQNTLKRYVLPVIGHLSITDIRTDDLLHILRDQTDDNGLNLWDDKPETARRILFRIRRIIARGIKKERLQIENVAEWTDNLEDFLPENGAREDQENHPSLPYATLPAFWADWYHERDISAQALRMVILSGMRTTAVRSAKWEEIDLQRRTWTIPKHRMKSLGSDFVLPLTQGMVDIFQFMNATYREAGSEYVFPGGRKAEPLSLNALRAKLKGLNERRRKAGQAPWLDEDGRDVVVHGFRATLATWGQETTEATYELRKTMLGQKFGKAVDRSYMRGGLLQKRLELMKLWENFVMSEVDRTLLSKAS